MKIRPKLFVVNFGGFLHGMNNFFLISHLTFVAFMEVLISDFYRTKLRPCALLLHKAKFDPIVFIKKNFFWWQFQIKTLQRNNEIDYYNKPDNIQLL